LTLALTKRNEKWETTILSINFEAVQVRNYLPVRNGYIFDLMVAGKIHEEFLEE
jgi:hypothetical protein